MSKDEKIVPKWRFPEFIGNWEIKPFKKYIKLYRGSSPRPIQDFITKNEGINWIKISDASDSNNFYITDVAEQITEEGAKKSRLVEKGELILANSMSFGATYEIGVSGCIYDGWFVLREYEDNFIKKFLLQQLNTYEQQKQYSRLSAGGVVKNISSDIVYETILKRPSKKEQQKIADCLSSIDEFISAEEKKLSLLNHYKKGWMQRLFPAEGKTVPNWRFPEFRKDGKWKIIQLKKICKPYKGSNFLKSDMDKNASLPCIHYGELFTKYNETIYVVYSKTNKKDGFKSKSGDILMPSSDVTPDGLAKASTIMLDDVILGGDMNILRPNEKFNSIFISYLLNASKRDIVKLISGTTIKHIYLNQIITLRLPITFNKLEQQKIADFLSNIDELISEQTNKIEALKQHKQALLQGLFPAVEEVL